jgi:hypothetical protein
MYNGSSAHRNGLTDEFLPSVFVCLSLPDSVIRNNKINFERILFYVVRVVGREVGS